MPTIDELKKIAARRTAPGTWEAESNIIPAAGSAFHFVGASAWLGGDYSDPKRLEVLNYEDAEFIANADRTYDQLLAIAEIVKGFLNPSAELIKATFEDRVNPYLREEFIKHEDKYIELMDKAITALESLP